MSIQDNVTAREGAEILGVKQPNFLYYVRIQDIATREEKNANGDRLYSRSDTLKVKKKLIEKARSKRPQQAPVMIDWLHSADLPAGIKLAQQAYSEEVDLAEAAIYQGWRRNNSQITLGGFSMDRSECYGSMQLVPVAESVALDVLSGRRTENSIKPEEVRNFEEPGAYVLLGTSAIVLPTYEPLLYRLLARYMDFWKGMYPHRYIHKIYAQTVSERGVMLAQHLFMSPRYDLAENAYELDLARPSASRIIRSFKQSLEQIAPLPDELRWSPFTETPTPPTATRRQPSPTVKRQPSPKTELPSTLEALTPFLGRHKLRTSHIKNIEQYTAAGDWKVGGASVKHAVDATGQVKILQDYKGHKGFTTCKVEGCPCHSL